VSERLRELPGLCHLEKLFRPAGGCHIQAQAHHGAGPLEIIHLDTVVARRQVNLPGNTPGRMNPVIVDDQLTVYPDLAAVIRNTAELVFPALVHLETTGIPDAEPFKSIRHTGESLGKTLVRHIQ